MSTPLARPVAGTFAAYVAGLAANLAVSILVARTMGTAGAGVIALALVGPNILALMGNLGLPGAVSHFLQKRPFGPRRVIAWASVINLVAGTALMLAYLAAAPLLRDWLTAGGAGAQAGPALGGAATQPADGAGYPLTLWLMTLAAAIIPLEIGLQNLMAVYQGRRMFGRRSAVLLSYRWLYVAAALAAVFAWRRDPTAVIAAGVAAYALTYLVGYLGVGRLLRSEPRERPRLDDARRLLGYAWRMHVGTLLVFLILRTDLFLIARLMGDTAEVGLYSRAVQVAEVVLYFMLAVENVLFPRMSALGRAEVPEAAARLCRRGLLAGAAMVLVFELAADVLILLPFGPEFAGSIVPLRILLPGVLAIGLARMLFAVFNALERPWVPAAIAAAGLVAVVALDLAWIPWLGIRGAALASLVTYVAMAVASLAWFARASRRPLAAFILPRRSDLAALRALWPRRNASGTPAATEKPGSAADELSEL